MHASMQRTDNFHDLHHCLRYLYLKTDKMIILAVAEAQNWQMGMQHVIIL